MPILTKLKKDNTPEIPTDIKIAVQKRLLNAFREFELPQYHDIALSNTMLDKAIESGYIIPFVEKDAGAYVDSLVKKTLDYTTILDSQDKLPEIITEYLTRVNYRYMR